MRTKLLKIRDICNTLLDTELDGVARQILDIIDKPKVDVNCPFFVYGKCGNKMEPWNDCFGECETALEFHRYMDERGFSI